jgi:hypothetical protein
VGGADQGVEQAWVFFLSAVTDKSHSENVWHGSVTNA